MSNNEIYGYQVALFNANIFFCIEHGDNYNNVSSAVQGVTDIEVAKSEDCGVCNRYLIDVVEGGDKDDKIDLLYE